MRPEDLEIRDGSDPSHDTMASRLRQCPRCDGAMRCSLLVQHLANQGDAGRTYFYVCKKCGHELHDFTGMRALYLLCVVLPLTLGLGGMLTYFGASMLADALTSGWGGNDASAVIMVLVLFLGGGIPLLLGGLWVTFGEIRAIRDRANSPFLPG